tara:strand:+ start:205 stop:441 length:237 start_codon:yes stop_codon:yes gene_type:complete
MDNKGFDNAEINIETPNDISFSINEKPLKSKTSTHKRVDINVLKSKLKNTESKELKKNLLVLSSLILGLSALGIYFSL